jgi:hypothetical protein
LRRGRELRPQAASRVSREPPRGRVELASRQGPVFIPIATAPRPQHRVQGRASAPGGSHTSARPAPRRFALARGISPIRARVFPASKQWRWRLRDSPQSPGSQPSSIIAQVEGSRDPSVSATGKPRILDGERPRTDEPLTKRSKTGSTQINNAPVCVLGDSGRIRTCDLPLRRRLLYPLSYGAELGLETALEPINATRERRDWAKSCRNRRGSCG